MKNLKKAAALTMIAGGLVAASAGAASATGHPGGPGTPGNPGGSQAVGSATHSPGVLSGNLVQAPVHVPVNVVGNTVNVIGALNPAFGNLGLNG
ncbi:chaplin [Streptomyces sp. NPDC060194]|uniref:chaplin n=1 Tax=Streptomyces sp. NPDC060194 TaxID=3347069 RepID=UPI0036482FBB